MVCIPPSPLGSLHEDRAEIRRLREALERIGVCCDNGSPVESKVVFIRRVTRDALDA